MNQLGYRGSYKPNPPNEADWVASNSVALVVELPYVRRPLPCPPPAPPSRDLSATTLPEEAESEETREVPAKMELIMDNLLNREEEPEDAILAASTVLHRLVAQARQEPPSPDWERDLDEL